MNWVDIIIVIVLAIGLGKGLANGFVRGLFGLAALVLGIMIAAANYEQVTELLFSRLEVGAQGQAILGFLLVFVIVLILVSVVGRILSKALKLASLGWLDRLAGGMLGVVMACVFTGVLLLLVVMAGLQSNTGVARSTVAPTVISVMDTVVAFAPDAVREMIEEHYVKLRLEWERARREAPSEGEEREEETQSVASIETASRFRGAYPVLCRVGVTASGA
ncbi:MAG: CvpA family protein [Candidatus Eisenbacteria bacterium]